MTLIEDYGTVVKIEIFRQYGKYFEQEIITKKEYEKRKCR